MGLFSSDRYDSLHDLFLQQLKDLYDAEHRLIEALPQMEERAHSPALKNAFRHHMEETERQVVRLETIFEKLEQTPERVKCAAMVGLISEGEEVLGAEGDPNVIDAALIAAAQRVEHYEIAGYGTARAFAQQLGLAYAAELLHDSLDEEVGADKKLTTIAEQSVNVAAT